MKRMSRFNESQFLFGVFLKQQSSSVWLLKSNNYNHLKTARGTKIEFRLAYKIYSWIGQACLKKKGKKTWEDHSHLSAVQ